MRWTIDNSYWCPGDHQSPALQLCCHIAMSPISEKDIEMLSHSLLFTPPHFFLLPNSMTKVSASLPHPKTSFSHPKTSFFKLKKQTTTIVFAGQEMETTKFPYWSLTQKIVGHFISCRQLILNGIGTSKMFVVYIGTDIFHGHRHIPPNLFVLYTPIVKLW